MRSPRRLAFFVLVAAATAACTVLNAFDDVKRATLDASTEASDVDVVVDAATDVVTDAGPAKGVIVVGGVLKEDGSQTPVLTALDPENGTELPMARDKRLVASVQYDGLRDLWYVFESNGSTHFPLPGDLITLHVRRLDTHTGAWDELQSIQVPTIVASTHVAVLRERLVYVAYQKDLDVRAGKALAVIDTSNPMQPTVVGSLTPLADEPIGLIGTRSSTSAGGSITLFHSSPIADAGGADAGPARRRSPMPSASRPRA